MTMPPSPAAWFPSFRSIAARFAGAALAIASLVFGIGFIFMTSIDTLADLSLSMHRVELPALDAAHRLDAGARDVSQLALNVSAATSPAGLRTAAERLEDGSRALDGPLERLTGLPLGVNRGADLTRERDALMAAARSLVLLEQQWMESDTVLLRRLAALHALQEQAAADDPAVQSVVASVALSATANSRLVIARIHQSIAERLPSIGDPAMRERLGTLALGDDGVPAIRVRVLDIERRRVNLQRAVVEIGTRFASLASALSREAGQAVERQHERTEAAGRSLRIDLAIAMSAVVLVMIALFALLHRGVLRRLLALRDQMVEGVRGHPVTLDTGGGDELADMAAAVQDYIRVIEQRTADLDRSQERLREKTAVLEAVNAITDDAMLGLDADGRILWVNRAAAALVGLEESGMTGRSCLELLPAWVVERHRAAAIEFLAGPDSSRTLGDWRSLGVLHRDGHAVPATATVSITTVGGRRHITATVRDMSETRRFEEDLVASRHAAEQANAAKSVFLANMSHELRTPLTGVIGMADFLADTALDNEQRECIDTLRASARTLLAVVNDVLDLSKIDAGRLELETVDLDLREILRTVLRLFRPMAAERRLSLTIDVDADDPAGAVVKGDPTRIQQVLFNLVGNAVKFTERGEVRIGLHARPQEDATVALRLTVTDTGIGMTTEQTGRLFAPFSQGDSSTTRRYGGTGLGLSIAHRLVSLMGGGIEVASRPGEGSRFTVHLRLPAGDPAGVEAERGDHAETIATRALHVLVADDNAVNRDLVKRFLTRMGHRVTLATNGCEAVAEVVGAPVLPDIVLMDVHMPELDGPSAARMIRSLPGAAATVPIVALTADALPEHRATFVSAGMNEVLVKPVDWSRLRSLLDRVAGTAAAPAASDDRPAAPPAAGVVDGARLDELFAILDGGEMRVILDQFTRNARELIDDLRRTADGDPAQARQIAHALKGAAGNVGATRLADLARGLEETLDKGGRPAALLGALEPAFRGTVAAFAERAARDTPPQSAAG